MAKADSLQELTRQESGAVQYSDGTIWIGNWTGIEGIPRAFVTGMIGLGEPLTARVCAAPRDVVRAMQEHEREQETEVSRTGFRAWRVNDVVVVVNRAWA